MAEVTGDFGGTPIQLNNAATEATLKQLVQAVSILAAKQGKDIKSQAALEKELKKFQQQMDKATKSASKLSKAQETEAKKRKEVNDALDAAAAKEAHAAKVTELSIKSIRGLSSAVENTVIKMTGMMSQMAGMGNSFSGAASMFSSLPLVGGLVGSVFGAIASSGDRVFNSFKQSASVGANFNGSIRLLVDSASGAGLTMDQFSGVIAKNGEALALMGGSTTAGALQLAKMGKIIRTSPIGDDLARLGFSTEDISNGMAKFGGMMARSGKQMDNASLAKTSAEYLKNLDAVSRLTGKSKDALQAEADARMADSQYRLMLAKLDPEGAKNLELMMNSIPKEHQAGIKEILATGTAVSEEAVAAMAFMNKTGQSAMVLGEQMRSSGTLTQAQAIQFDKSRQAEMKTMADEAKGRGGLLNTIGNFGDAVQQKLTVGILDSAARTKDLGQVMTEQALEQKNAAQKQKDAMDPAAMQKFQQDIAAMSNSMTVLLAQYMPMLQSAFGALATFINDYVVPVFKFVMDNFQAIVVTLVAVKAGMIAMGVAMKAIEMQKALSGPGTSPARPMYVKDISGGGGGGGVMDSVGGKKGKGIGKLAKGAGVAGAVISAGMLVSDLSDISEEEKQGTITQAQAKEKKGGAVGSAGGGALGAWGGAAAGAAIGSVVPGVGTVIGGVVGGALGAWGGSWAGEKAGSAVAAAPKGDDVNAKNWAYSVYTGKASFDQVPAPYKTFVKKLLENPPPEWEKAPVKADAAPPKSTTAQAPTPSAASMDFNSNDAASLFKTAQTMYGVPVQPKSTASTATAEADAMKRALEVKKTTDENAVKIATDSQTKTTASSAPSGQESSESLLSSLNSKLDQLIKVNLRTAELNDKQLTVQRSLSGDVFQSA